MLSNTTLSIAAGAGLAFVGYCIYFDHKRRSDPLYRTKVKERRRKARECARAQANSNSEIPDLNDQESMQRFFLQEVQLGEELLAAGDIENGVEHLSNAVAVCGQPQQLLQVLQQSLPAQVFQLLLLRLPIAGKRVAAGSGMNIPPGMTGQLMEDDDLE